MCHGSLSDESHREFGIVKFCDKTISETAAYINSTEKALKQNMEKEEFQKIKETISRNEEAVKRVLKQRKFKNFNYLKHKPDTERNNHKPQQYKTPWSQHMEAF